jgi:nucleotide-binding universal stress UspA family protein
METQAGHVDRIVVLLDGSALAECTIPHAVKLADALRSRVLLLLVNEPGGARPTWESERGARSGETGQSYLSRKVRLFDELGIRVSTLIVEGIPAERALEVAEVTTADLIILSTHGGKSGLTRFPLSGTASKIVAAAPMSVMVVRSEEGPITSDDYPYRTILAPVDLTSHSYASARLAARIARSHEAELLLVTVVPTPEMLNTPPASASRLAERLADFNRGSALRHLGELTAELGGSVKVRHRVVEDLDVAHGVSTVADDENASLIVVGAHGRSLDDAYPHGVVASRLLEHVTRPVLVFQDEGEPEHERSSSESSRSLPAEIA